MMFQELQAEPRSAAAVDARREEKLINLGPVLERVYDEALDKIIDRVFGIMWRAGLFPPPPSEIQGLHDQARVCLDARRGAESRRHDRHRAPDRALGNLAAVKPDVMDVVDDVEMAQDYAMHAQRQSEADS
jgi:hypothetical protein